MTPEQKLVWYERRCKALEELLGAYRLVGSRPSERLFTELDRTGKHIAYNGQWREEGR